MYMVISELEFSLEIDYVYIEFPYIEVRLYRSKESPFHFDLTGVDLDIERIRLNSRYFCKLMRV